MTTIFQRRLEAFALANPDKIAWSPETGWTELGQRLIPPHPFRFCDDDPPPIDDDPNDLDRWQDDGGAFNDRDY